MFSAHWFNIYLWESSTKTDEEPIEDEGEEATEEPEQKDEDVDADGEETVEEDKEKEEQDEYDEFYKSNH